VVLDWLAYYTPIDLGYFGRFNTYVLLGAVFGMTSFPPLIPSLKTSTVVMVRYLPSLPKTPYIVSVVVLGPVLAYS